MAQQDWHPPSLSSAFPLGHEWGAVQPLVRTIWILSGSVTLNKPLYPSALVSLLQCGEPEGVSLFKESSVLGHVDIKTNQGRPGPTLKVFILQREGQPLNKTVGKSMG